MVEAPSEVARCFRAFSEACLPVVVIRFNQWHEGGFDDVVVLDTIVGKDHHGGGLRNLYQTSVLFSNKQKTSLLWQSSGCGGLSRFSFVWLVVLTKDGGVVDFFLMSVLPMEGETDFLLRFEFKEDFLFGFIFVVEVDFFLMSVLLIDGEAEFFFDESLHGSSWLK